MSISFVVESPVPEEERVILPNSWGDHRFFADYYQVGTNMPGHVRAKGAMVTKTGKRHATNEGYRIVAVDTLTEPEREALVQGCEQYAEHLTQRLAIDLANLGEHLDAIRRTFG